MDSRFKPHLGQRFKNTQYCFLNSYIIKRDIDSALFLAKSMIKLRETNKKIINELAITNLLEGILKQEKDNLEATRLLTTIRPVETTKQRRLKPVRPHLPY